MCGLTFYLLFVEFNTYELVFVRESDAALFIFGQFSEWVQPFHKLVIPKVYLFERFKIY